RGERGPARRPCSQSARYQPVRPSNSSSRSEGQSSVGPDVSIVARRRQVIAVSANEPPSTIHHWSVPGLWVRDRGDVCLEHEQPLVLPLLLFREDQPPRAVGGEAHHLGRLRPWDGQGV